MPRRDQLKTEFLKYLLQEKAISLESYQRLAREETYEAVEAEVMKEVSITEELLAKARAKAFGLPYVDLVGKKIDAEVLKIVPLEFAQNYKVVAFERNGDTVQVAMLTGTDLKAQEAVEFLAREKALKVQYAFTTQVAYQNILKQYASLGTEVKEALDVAADRFAPDKDAVKEAGGMEEVVKSAPVAKMVSVILKHAVDARASDIHIEPVMNETRIRYRIDGDLQTSLILPKYIHSAIVSRIKVMSNLKIDETRIPQDGRIRTQVAGRDIDFRISTLPLYNNEKVVMRILDTEEKVSTLSDLGFTGRSLKLMDDNIKKPHGMFLVTGPTGSGKSTTLYAVLNVLNQEGVNIVTLEDPVEYYLKGVNQSQIYPEIGFTFAAGLRSILRQDPDVVMVGEIRDNETAELAIHAALTGHIVLSTLHTNDALGAIPRLVDMKVEPFLIASTLNIVVAQRLVRKICKHCREPQEVPEDVKKEVIHVLEPVKSALPPEINLEKLSFWKGKGCPRCSDTGYSGRDAVAEVLNVDDELKSIIARGAQYDEVKNAFKHQALFNIEQDGLIKAITGVTTIEEALAVTRE